MSSRQNPDQLLKAIQDEEVNQNKGHLIQGDGNETG